MHKNDEIIIEDDAYNASAECVIDEDQAVPEVEEDDEEVSDNIEDDEKIIANDDGTITVTLEYPVEVVYKRGDQTRKDTVSSVTFHRARGEDLIASGKFRNDTERGFVLMARMARLSDIIFRKMDGVDVERCGRAITPFFPKSRKTGKK